MKRYISLLLVLTMVAGLCACGQKETVPTWQEQYDLGVRYLSEGNYEEAIIAFTAAIEIDPKRTEAYIGLADVYVAQGDTEKAAEILQQAIEAVGETDGLSTALAALENETQSEEPSESGTNDLGIPEILSSTEYYAAAYVAPTEILKQTLFELISPGLADDHEAVFAMLQPEVLLPTMEAAGIELYESADGRKFLQFWTIVDDTLMRCDYGSWHDSNIGSGWSVGLAYRPKTGTAFQWSLDSVSGNPPVLPQTSQSYLVGTTVNYLLEGEFKEHVDSQTTQFITKEEYHCTAEKELLHGECIRYYEVDHYADYVPDYAFAEYTKYEHGYLQLHWQDENGDMCSSKRVYADGRVEYSTADERIFDLQQIAGLR